LHLNYIIAKNTLKTKRNAAAITYALTEPLALFSLVNSDSIFTVIAVLYSVLIVAPYEMFLAWEEFF
jgi:hypothetical protein